MAKADCTLLEPSLGEVEPGTGDTHFSILDVPRLSFWDATCPSGQLHGSHCLCAAQIDLLS